MSPYTHVLAAIDVLEGGEAVLKKAIQLASLFDAKLSLVNVVEYMPVDPAGDAVLGAAIELSEERQKRSKERIESWCAENAIVPEGIHIPIGAVSTEIVRIQGEIQADLILVGHHPHTGFFALFGNTEASVLNHARCDVLATALPD